MKLRKALSILLAVCMVLSTVTFAYADEIPAETLEKIEETAEENKVETATEETVETKTEVESVEAAEEESKTEETKAEPESVEEKKETVTETVTEEPAPKQGEEEKPEETKSEDVIVLKNDTLENVVVTLKAPADAFDNKGNLTLKVEEVEIVESEKLALKECGSDKENVAKRVTYDITVLDDGEDIQPKKEVDITFDFKDAPSGADGVNIYHHVNAEKATKIDTEVLKKDAKEENAVVGEAKEADSTEATTTIDKTIETKEVSDEELAATDDVELEYDLKATGKTNGFSHYTVDFTYKDKTISIAGDSTGNKLDDIVSELGIEEKVEEAEVYQNAECKGDPTNGEVKNEEGKTLYSVYEINDTWYVDAVNAFSTEHGLIVKTADGAEYKIKVTDAQTETSVSYIDSDGTSKSHDATVVTDSDFTWGDDGNDGWYVVKNDINVTAGYTVTGAVKLILVDDKTLNVTGASNKAGICVSGDSNSLAIYGQTNGTGNLTATGKDGGAGIGGGYYESGSNIIINGGTITATGKDGGAGIGGGYGESGNYITINGGTVTATGSGQGDGIGGYQENGLNIYAAADVVVKAGENAGSATEITHTSTQDIAIDLAGKIYATAKGPGPEFYAVFNTDAEEGKVANTLSFYYDTNGDTRTGTKYDSLPTAATEKTDWGYDGIRSNVKNVVIDSSVADYHGLKSTAYMFAYMNNADNISGCEHLDVSNVTSMSNMFGSYAQSSTNITAVPDVSEWDTGNVTDMSNMFGLYAKSSTTITAVPNVSNWNTEKIKKTENMFCKYAETSTKKLQPLDLSGWSIAALEVANTMFTNYAKNNTQGDPVVYAADWSTIKTTGVTATNMFTNSKLKGTTTGAWASANTNATGCFTKKTYTVTFDMQDHGTQVEPQTVAKGDKVEKPDPDPTATGYSFGGWYKETGCTNAWNFGTDTVSADTTLFAKWTPESTTYTVTFDMKGHGTQVESQTVAEGGKVTKPTDPTASGYAFYGWYKETGCTNAWDFNTDTVSADTTLFAKWNLTPPVPTGYTITFDANGGSGTMPSMTTSGGKITLPENGFTAPVGKKFAGWGVGSKMGEAKAPGTEVIFVANSTVFAMWEDDKKPEPTPPTPETKKETTVWTSVPTVTGSASAPVSNGSWTSTNGIFQYVVNGEPLRNATAWITYKGADGKQYTGCFYFDKSGNMAAGWQKIAGEWFFFDTTQGSGYGIMKTSGWIESNGKQYYVGADGKMLTNTTTPDGKRVGTDGARID